MDAFLIRGGRPLKGRVKIRGAKNAVLPIMTASILADQPCVIENVPVLRDIVTMSKVLEHMGATVHDVGTGTLTVDCKLLKDHIAPYELVRTMRASVLVMGPLLAKLGKAKVALPGGCAIGLRPIDLHLKGIEALGASVKSGRGYVQVSARKLHGAEICLDYASVGATENLLMACVLAKGTSVIENAAREPEVQDLAKFLKALGAKITGEGTSRIVIEGVSGLGSATHCIIPDRIEAGTYLTAGAITNGRVTVDGVIEEHLGEFLKMLGDAGANIEANGPSITVSVPDGLKPVKIRTMPYPGFPTDMQAQFMALMSVTPGISSITETVFENRFMQVAELNRMGANIRIERNTAIINGVSHLSGAEVMASDLRASAALVLAGLVSRGETKISRIYHIDRGYDQIERRLKSLGADIRRVAD
ncbi:MAG: UDP-N-acetylglucosamine 1-carboxyvinyltransferase [Candidatus Abyssobacteria bacterium SURF_5]|uniref:UDP-N-acetylglucosamine 1-carboxyvinyltransferase n=1 Tax=Abyssobacteria bacterium (strain SURF_5) TaxID=2093360 RepID=A0A3A4P4V0_ABYX5|nr:MAG: UDP-N-acetylglucosamine 1-carboxyvinyltransferase [Candidatus Abyssubacteria bacterium SURF_5]